MNLITAVLAAGWLLEALVLGVLMRRRGFDPYVWTLLGLFLGPVALFLAVSRIVSPPAAEVHHVRAGHAGSGSLKVLIGVDGSPEADAAVGRLRCSSVDRRAASRWRASRRSTRRRTTSKRPSPNWRS